MELLLTNVMHVITQSVRQSVFSSLRCFTDFTLIRAMVIVIALVSFFDRSFDLISLFMKQYFTTDELRQRYPLSMSVQSPADLKKLSFDDPIKKNGKRWTPPP